MNLTARCTRYALRKLSTLPKNEEADAAIQKLRNIGILAHIDAGKTTTTERMLYYSDTIRSMGEVHHGNTVTDFMDQERQRGITITAAAVSFPWNEYQFNLIDTPGHIDFTMEVEQSLSVLDSAVVILDGSAGVEAQTVTVWRQCDDYNLPRIVYVNKMDRNDASVNMCMESLRKKLGVTPIRLHIPIKTDNKKLKGLIDIINLEQILWNVETYGRSYKVQKLTESLHENLWETAVENRRKITDELSDHDELLADLIIQSECLDSIDSSLLKQSLRKSTLERKVFPVFCGSSYKNIGVQLLMDGVIDYLPSPFERNHLYSCFNNSLCAKAFKVQHDDRKGVLTYFRIFSGHLSKGQKIYNIPKLKTEQVTNLYVPYADEYKAVNEVTTGNVAVISGLKLSMTGDLITTNEACVNKAKKDLVNKLSDPNTIQDLKIPSIIQNIFSTDDFDPNEAATTILHMGTKIPNAVFFCSIEAPSLAYQNQLDNALSELQREDPSIRVSHNIDTSQTVLAGMGELHLEIIKDRILKEYKIDAEIGPLQIAYKETITSYHKESHKIDTTIGGSKHFVNLTLSAYPVEDTPVEILKFDTSQESASNLAHIHPRYIQALKQGVGAALVNGPKLHCPIINVGVKLHWFETTYGTADTFVAAAVTQCLRKIFNSNESLILEPIMFLEVVCPGSYSTVILNDLSKRRAEIQLIDVRGDYKVVRCLTPLSELMGYSTAVRIISSGTATFAMEFYCHRSMTNYEEEKAIKAYRGF